MADTHAQIISRNGSDPAVADKVGAKVHQVRDWRLRNSIPGENWKAFVDQGLASWTELGDAAAEEAARKAAEKAARKAVAADAPNGQAAA